jgi:uncharacterized membrane protein YbhN (UPF0104 family)
VDRRLEWGLFLVSLVFAGFATGMVMSVHHQHWIRRLILAANRRFPGRLISFTREKTTQLLDGVVPLGTLPRMLAAITSTAIIWGLEGAVCYVVGLALWYDMRLHTALLFLVVVNFATLMPITMGGIGTIEVAGPLYLISSGISPPLALAMVLLQHAGRYLFTTITGAVFYLGGSFQRNLFSKAW